MIIFALMMTFAVIAITMFRDTDDELLCGCIADDGDGRGTLTRYEMRCLYGSRLCCLLPSTVIARHFPEGVLR